MRRHRVVKAVSLPSYPEDLGRSFPTSFERESIHVATNREPTAPCSRIAARPSPHGARAGHVRAPLTGFAEFGVSEPVVDALKMRGIAGAFAIQELVLRDAIAGRDVLARSRTGSGKTLAFAVPIVERLTPSGGSPTALILAPTRELASQVTEEFRAIADVRQLHVAAVYGGVAIGPQAKRARRADIVIATPGRLLDLVARKLLRLDRVRICVLDEADRMLDMGFLPDVKRILEMLRPDRQTMLFSATLDGEVGRLGGALHARPGEARGGRRRRRARRRRPTTASSRWSRAASRRRSSASWPPTAG